MGMVRAILIGATVAALVGCGPPPLRLGSSPSNPAPIGASLVTDVKAVVGDAGVQEFTLRMTLKEVICGVEAWQLIKEASQFNAPPSPGYEYVLLRFHVEVLRSPWPDAHLDPNLRLFYTAWRLWPDKEEYRGQAHISNPKAPEPTLSTALYEGDSHEGWVALEVFELETMDRPVVGVGLDFSPLAGPVRIDIVGGAWWRLYE